jgi:Tfp pilus assembly protein PilV
MRSAVLGYIAPVFQAFLALPAGPELAPTRRMPALRSTRSSRGITLVEVLVASLLLVVLLTSVVPLVAASRRLTADAALAAGAMRGAVNQLEALRVLPWWVGDGPPTEDLSTDLSRPWFQGGGAGLSLVSVDVLDSSTAGYEDAVDAAGQRLTVDGPLLMRWAVLPSPVGPACRTLVVEVAPAVQVRAGAPMAVVATARLHTTRCVGGVRP